MKRISYAGLCIFLFLSLLIFQPLSVSAYSYTYDASGRLTKMTYDDGSSITYTYDNAGNVLQRIITVQYSLVDVILVLQAVAGEEPPAAQFRDVDVNENGSLGLEEAIFFLQRISGLR